MNTPESLVQSIDYTKQSHPDEKKLMESTFSSTLDINSIPDTLPTSSIHNGIPEDIPDVPDIPEVPEIPEEEEEEEENCGEVDVIPEEDGDTEDVVIEKPKVP